jgi:hypothetical protein
MKAYNEASFERSTRMVALARVFLGNVTVAATTALQAINPAGMFGPFRLLMMLCKLLC